MVKRELNLNAKASFPLMAHTFSCLGCLAFILFLCLSFYFALYPSLDFPWERVDGWMGGRGKLVIEELISPSKSLLVSFCPPPPPPYFLLLIVPVKHLKIIAKGEIRRFIISLIIQADIFSSPLPNPTLTPLKNRCLNFILSFYAFHGLFS